MTITLTRPVRIGGVELAAATTQTLSADVEADLVARGCATYATNPMIGGQVPVMADFDPLTKSLASLTGGEFDVLSPIAVAAGGRMGAGAASAVIAGGAATAIASAAPFGGWGCQFSVPNGGFEFSHLRIAQMKQTAANAAQRWQNILFTVRSLSKNGAVIATAEMKIPAYASTLNNVVVELSEKVTESLIGGKTYWIDYCAYNAAGALCPCGYYQSASAASVQSNFVALSTYYRLSTTGEWVLAVGGMAGYGYPLIIEPYLSADSIIPAASGPLPEVVLPTLYAVVGREINCYFSGLVEPRASALEWDVTCAIGKQQNERFTAVPAAISAGTAITIAALDPVTQTVFDSAASTIIVADAAKSGTCELLVIGDSTTASGEATAELLVLDAADAAISLTLRGTQGTGPNFHEGRSGWGSAAFVTTGSPFYNASAVDMSNYITSNGMTGLTHVVVNLGINDIFSQTTDAAVDAAIETLITNVGKIVQGIQAFSASIKIGVALTTPPSDSQDSFGESYAAGQTLLRYRRNWFRLIKRLKAAIDAAGSSVVYVLPFNASLDTKNNMSTATVAANSRNAATIIRQSNGVHPAASGYLQIADVIYAWIKCTLP